MIVLLPHRCPSLRQSTHFCLSQKHLLVLKEQGFLPKQREDQLLELSSPDDETAKKTVSQTLPHVRFVASRRGCTFTASASSLMKRTSATLAHHPPPTLRPLICSSIARLQDSSHELLVVMRRGPFQSNCILSGFDHLCCYRSHLYHPSLLPM